GFDLQPAELVGEVQLAAVHVVGIDHVDERLAHVGDAVEEGLLDAGEVAADDAQLASARVAGVLVHAVALGELGGEELVDELDIVVDAADLEDLVAALHALVIEGFAGAEVLEALPCGAVLALVPAALDVLPQLDTD